MSSITVWGSGPKDAKMALIGEAPGIEELRMREAFVGKAGRMLTDCTRRAGVNRELCYISNLFKEMPPGGSIKIWAGFNSQGRFYGSKKYDEYREILRQELQDVSANIIVPLGGVPYYALTGLGVPGITKRRGSIVQTLPEFGSRKVIGTIHPSAVERGNFKYKHYITMDLARAKTEAEFPELRLPERTVYVKPSYGGAMEYMDEIISRRHPVGFDIEVVNKCLACFALAQSWDRVMCIPLFLPNEHYFTEEQEYNIMSKLAEILGNPEIPIIGQNLIFDMSFMHRHYNIVTRNYHDTMIAQRVVNPDFPAGLDFLCSIFTKEPYYKDEGKMWSDFLGDIIQFWIYNCKDAAVVMEIFPKLMRHIKRQGNEATYMTQLQAVAPLMYMGLRGLRCDVDYKEDALIKATEELAVLEAKFDAATGGGVNPKSSKQLMHYFYEVKGYKKIYKGRGEKKALTTDVDAIKEIAKKYRCPAAKVLREHRITQKYVSSYLAAKLDSRFRLVTSVNPVGTKNGRISANKDPIENVGMNLQTMPHKFRRCVLADPGNILFELDISMGENRCVAYFAPEWNMIKAFENGIDLHIQTAALIFGIPYSQVTTKDFTCPVGDGSHSQRFWGKKANHGLNYGEGYKKFARINELLERDSKVIVDRYHRAYPGIKLYQEWVEEHLRKNCCTMRNPFGRLRTFHDRFAQEMKNSAYNFLPQSTIADIINRWGLNYYYDNSAPGQVFEYCEMLLQIHDSLVFQIPLYLGWSYMATCVVSLRDSLEQNLNWQGRSWNLPIDMNLGFNLGPNCSDRGDINYNPLGMVSASCRGSVDEVAANIEEAYSKITTH